MTVILFIFILLVFRNITFAKEGTFFEDYLAPIYTNVNKGIFVFFVFMTHFASYLDTYRKYDELYIDIRSFHAQLIVTMFLFYSGYGILKGIDKKGKDYVKDLPKRAFTQLWHVDIIIVLFLITNMLLGIKHSIKQTLLAFVLWRSIGNSDWYMLAIIVLYLFTFVAFILPVKKREISVFVLTIFTVAFLFLLKEFKPAYFYNTLICYPLGAWYALFHQKFEKLIQKNDLIYLSGTLAILLAFCFSYNRRAELLFYEIWVVCFVVLFILISMKIRFYNSFLEFLGNHIFSLYFLQRIPMIILNQRGTLNKQPYLSFVVCFVATVLLAYAYEKIIDNISKKIVARK